MEYTHTTIVERAAGNYKGTLKNFSHVILLGDMAVMSVDEVDDYVNLAKRTCVMKKSLSSLCDIICNNNIIISDSK